MVMPAELPPYVSGTVQEWELGRILRLWRCLARVPRKRRALIQAARASRVCLVRGLAFCGIPHDGTATEFQGDATTELISLDLNLFDHPSKEVDLGVPLLVARMMEEAAHVWDFRLERSSLWELSSAGAWWLVECDELGPLPFPIPNRKAAHDKDYIVAEDWASSVLWFVFRPAALARVSPGRSGFVQRVFAAPLPPACGRARPWRCPGLLRLAYLASLFSRLRAVRSGASS